MNTYTKVAIVLGGYAAAFLLAGAAVAVRVALVSTPDADASSGMYAFGDMLLFLGVFGLLALVPTATGFWFVRNHERFWNGLAKAGLVFAATGVAAVAIFVLTGRFQQPAWMIAGFLALLRLMGAPVFMIGFLVAAPFAATRWARRVLLLCAASELTVGAVHFIRLLVLRG